MQIDPDLPADPITTRTVSAIQLLVVCESERNKVKGTDSDANGKRCRSCDFALEKMCSDKI